MTPADLSPVIREALAVHESLRKLKFPAANIYIALLDNICVVLRMPGHPDFVINLEGPGAEESAWTPETLIAAWEAAAKAYNDGGEFTDAQRKELWETSHARANSVGLVSALVGRGLK